ncbi:hypothetical protein TD95_001305 [Thielaviopsis punctulata]|uniref:DUF985 domain-containing protein n=1 Tax=Thielaviopsis punctulata TaxID=72032 RepID=A0A0F4ZLE8_9PEZI|nr:hypothetical protein TD95_001305 [Thielaviopsis punctulata]
MVNVTEIKPFFTASTAVETPAVQTIISALNMQRHIEGGYFVETDRDQALVPSPFPGTSASEETLSLVSVRPGYTPGFRNASTSIFYLLTPVSPAGRFHANRARTIHTLHAGRGKYVLIHPSGRVETYIVGKNVANGEKLQWVVEGGVWKASYLLPDEGGEGSEGLLISETVVPGFEYQDHQFMPREKLVEVVGEDVAKELDWLVRPSEEKAPES